MLYVTERILYKNLDKPTTYSIFTAVILFTIFALAIARPAYASVGAIPGEANVQPSGTSSYIIPIRVAPGITGLQPELALQYDSGVGDGLLGTGWAVSGLSSIHRCPRTYEQDGEYKGVTLDRTDRLCLDGKRLVAYSGTYGESGTEYRTEIDEYSKIVQSGTCDGSCSFTVSTKSGRRYQYGLTADASYNVTGHAGALLWAVNRIEDTAGNWIDFVYNEDPLQNTQLISSIRYGGVGGLVAGNVEFRYQPKTDIQNQYTHGVLIVRDEVISHVITRSASNEAIRNYQLSYQPSPANGRSLLSSVEECTGEPGQAGDCLAPTNLSWYGGNSAYRTWESSSEFPADLDRCRGITQGDANGDGRTDLICAYDTDNQGSSAAITYVKLADDSGYGEWENWYQGSRTRSFDLQRCAFFRAADFNGDGLTDLICGYDGVAYVQTSSGSSYSAWSVWEDGSSKSPWPRPVGTANRAYAQELENRTLKCVVLEVADVDGDGRSDLLCATPGETYVQLSSGTSLSNWTLWGSSNGSGFNDAGKCLQRMAADVNGDGLPDAICVYDTSKTGSGAIVTYVQLATGSGYTAWQVWKTSSGIFDLENCDEFAAADFNADGLTDLVCKHNGNTYFVQTSTGENFTDWENWGADASLATNTCLDVIATDADGDGRSDLICPQNYSGGKTYVKRALTSGAGFSSWELWATSSVPQGDCRRTFLGDTQGNSMPDIICLANNKRTYAQRYKYGAPGEKRFTISGAPRDPNLSLLVYLSGDMLKAVDDGVGSPTEFVYSTLADEAVYSSDFGAGCSATGQEYPINCRVGARYVVAESKTDNGIGGVSYTSYLYRGGRAHMLGRGFLGFSEVERTDQTSHISTITTYDQAFALNLGAERYLYASTGLPARIKTEIRNGATVIPLKDAENLYTIKSSANDSVFEVQQASSSETTHEITGELVKRVSTSYGSVDEFGNPLQIVATTLDGNDPGLFREVQTTTTDNQYYNDAGLWILGRLVRSTVTTTSSDSADSGVRVSSFEYDPGTGFLTAEIIEPGDPELELRTSYQYDIYGNRVSATTSDSGTASYPITAGTSTNNYDFSSLVADSTYSIVSTNAMGHTETKIIDARFGVTRRLTGPNDLATSWAYDGFGVKQAEYRADGTSTRWERAWCGDAACPEYAVYSGTTTTPGSPPLTSYMDSLEREVRSATIGLNGRTIRKDTRYDEEGRVAAASRNYFEGDVPCGNGPCWSTFQYDVLDRVIRVDSPDGGIIETLYNGLSTTERRYDVAGTYDQSSSITVNAIGQEISITDAAGQVLTKAYDAQGNLIRTTDPAANSTLLSYDRAGRKIAMTDPDMGAWEYRYDALGQLRWQKDAKNQIVTNEYDVLGRMVRRSEPEDVTRWNYDAGRKGIGKLTNVVALGGFRQLKLYDEFGRPWREFRRLDGNRVVSQLAYDDLGRVTQLRYPGGFQVDYTYNAIGYLTQVSNAADPQEVFWRADDSDADGNVVLSTLGNGLQTVRLYDPFNGNLQGISTGFGAGSDVQFLTYGFDALGNLKKRTDENQSLTEDFRYDVQNRLIEAAVTGADSQRFAYDTLGNITSKGIHSDYRYGESGAGPHAVSFARGSAYSYDANGNMTSGAGRSLVWTSYNKPQQIVAGKTDIRFEYGPDRARFKQTRITAGKSTTTLYFGKLYEQITRAGKTDHKFYIQAGGQTVATHTWQADGARTTRYLHHDHLGSTDVVSDELGNVVQRMSFSAFGTRRNLDWSATSAQLEALQTTRGFTGHEQLDEVGLVHMNGRVYDPALSRFLSADPTVQFANNLQNYNRYSYVNNNPLSYTDPSGFGIFSKIKKAFKKVSSNKWVRLGAGIVAAVVAAPYAVGYIALLTGNATLAYAAGGFVGGFALGGSVSGNLQGAALGGLKGATFAAAGNAGGILGDISNLGGGLDGAILQRGISGILRLDNPVARSTKKAEFNTVRSAVVGRAAVVAGGEKFANGATTGAYGYLFSECAHGGCDRFFRSDGVPTGKFPDRETLVDEFERRRAIGIFDSTAPPTLDVLIDDTSPAGVLRAARSAARGNAVLVLTDALVQKVVVDTIRVVNVSVHRSSTTTLGVYDPNTGAVSLVGTTLPREGFMFDHREVHIDTRIEGIRFRP